MEGLKQWVAAYTDALRDGRMALAYRGILELMGTLRADLERRYPQVKVGSLYPGYLEWSFVPLTSEALMAQKLKVLIVYVHEKARFELWLAARNRAAAKRLQPSLPPLLREFPEAFHDEKNPDTLMEKVLCESPDFDQPEVLIRHLEEGAAAWIEAVQSKIAKQD